MKAHVGSMLPCHGLGMAHIYSLDEKALTIEQSSTALPKKTPHKMRQKSTRRTHQPQQWRGNFFKSCRQCNCRAWVRFSEAHKTQNNSFQHKTCLSFDTVEQVICYKNIAFAGLGPQKQFWSFYPIIFIRNNWLTSEPLMPLTLRTS